MENLHGVFLLCFHVNIYVYMYIRVNAQNLHVFMYFLPLAPPFFTPCYIIIMVKCLFAQ